MKEPIDVNEELDPDLTWKVSWSNLGFGCSKKLVGDLDIFEVSAKRDLEKQLEFSRLLLIQCVSKKLEAQFIEKWIIIFFLLLAPQILGHSKWLISINLPRILD